MGARQAVAKHHEHSSIIMTLHLNFGSGDRKLAGDSPLTVALLDRLLRHNRIIQIQGESFRLKEKSTAGIVVKKTYN